MSLASVAIKLRKALSFEGAFYVVTKNHRGSAGGDKVNYTSVEYRGS